MVQAPLFCVVPFVLEKGFFDGRFRHATGTRRCVQPEDERKLRNMGRVVREDTAANLLADAAVREAYLGG